MRIGDTPLPPARSMGDPAPPDAPTINFIKTCQNFIYTLGWIDSTTSNDPPANFPKPTWFSPSMTLSDALGHLSQLAETCTLAYTKGGMSPEDSQIPFPGEQENLGTFYHNFQVGGQAFQQTINALTIQPLLNSSLTDCSNHSTYTMALAGISNDFWGPSSINSPDRFSPLAAFNSWVPPAASQ